MLVKSIRGRMAYCRPIPRRGEHNNNVLNDWLGGRDAARYLVGQQHPASHAKE
ncbi:MAG: hypothetical protein CPDRYDRY_2105 [uncultured Paraburkholderia sp.]|nr:MAG: hypothetical protein CPDRYDRY_2105 [uncultured Paraburkholderia sp.]